MSYNEVGAYTAPVPQSLKALDAAAHLRGCALKQLANARESLHPPAPYSNEQASTRKALFRASYRGEGRSCLRARPRASATRALSDIGADGDQRSQEAQEIRHWLLALSVPVSGTPDCSASTHAIRIFKRKAVNESLLIGRTRERVVPPPRTPLADHPPRDPDEPAKQCRRLHAASVRVLVSDDGDTSTQADLGLLNVSIERQDGPDRARTSVVARDPHHAVRLAFSLVRGRRTSVVDGPGGAAFDVAIKGDRRGSCWQAVIFRFGDSEERNNFQAALESMGEEDISSERGI